jgi:hypothetical protein
LSSAFVSRKPVHLNNEKPQHQYEIGMVGLGVMGRKPVRNHLLLQSTGRAEGAIMAPWQSLNPDPNKVSA